MASSKKRRRSSKRYTRREFAPIAKALGQLSLAWNDLQEMQAVLFWQVLSKGKETMPLSAWYSLKSDRAQREMLRAVVETKQYHAPNGFAAAAIALINAANSLEDDRNNAMHSPLFYADGPIARAAGLAGVKTAHFLGNPRATRLANKPDLLAEFRWCRDAAMALADYAHALGNALSDSSRPLPGKLSLPNRGQKKSRQGQRRQLRKE